MSLTGGKGDEAAGPVFPGKTGLIPLRHATGFGRCDPDLEDAGRFIFTVVLRVLNAVTGRHYLNVACFRAAFIAQMVLVGDGTKGVRIECRIPGSDINPYLACAAQLAAGIAGMEEKLSLEEPVSGDVYNMTSIPEIPNTLRAATETLRSSDMLRKAMGDDVIDHYTRAAEVEQEAFDAVVTDWELQRGFERA